MHATPARHPRAPRRAAARLPPLGFSLLELMVVIAIIALGTGLVSVALRDRAASHLEEEGARLSALLESARAQARIGGGEVHFELGADNRADATADARRAAFRFVGLSPGATQALPSRWLDDETRAEIVGARALLLGPEPLLPPQRVRLSLGNQQLTVGTDGLGPFAVMGTGAATTASAAP